MIYENPSQFMSNLHGVQGVGSSNLVAPPTNPYRSIPDTWVTVYTAGRNAVLPMCPKAQQVPRWFVPLFVPTLGTAVSTPRIHIPLTLRGHLGSPVRPMIQQSQGRHQT